MIRHHAPSLQADLIGEHEKETNIALFRGIPYASVQERWRHSSVLDQLSSPFDATKFGPRCSQEVGDVLVTGSLNDPVPGDDEFACLNLNIASPASALEADKPLPVMVWIHGGAFRFGANSVGRYRPQEFVSLAIKNSHPIVLVQIGYRLGPFGFAVSSDLQEEAKEEEEGQASGNYGLIDQRNALQWVQSHIRDFGGDPNNVTAFGISAGSASVYFHIMGGDPLFDRGICMSGAAPSLGPLPFKIYDEAWKDLCVRSGVNSEISAKDRIRRLRELPPEQLLSLYSKEALSVCAGAAKIPLECRISNLAATSSRCKSLMLGDSRVEAIIFDGLIARLPFSEFIARVHKVFPQSSDAEAFLDAFGFNNTSSDMEPEAYRDAMRHLLSVSMFQYPNFEIANAGAPGEKIYLYHFEEPSPYPEPTHGLPYHGLCALVLHNNDAANYDAPLQTTAREMARVWTEFAYGIEPWEAYTVNKKFQRIGPAGQWEMKDVKDDTIRDYRYLKFTEEHADQIRTLGRSMLHRQIREELQGLPRQH